jgi:hypothetical protein
MSAINVPEFVAKEKMEGSHVRLVRERAPV